jgi:hypothetical protein
MLANLTAMTTGLRVGEIMALRMENIGEEYLTIDYSYSRLDGMKCTKTDEPRRVPVLPQLREALIRQGKKNPHENGFIFFCDSADRPWDIEGPLLQLRKMLVHMKMGEALYEKDVEKRKQARAEAIAYWKKRNVVYHSWRHFYSARMADKIDARKVMLATGHKTEAVFQVYADHALESDLKEVATATDSVFTQILPYREGELQGPTAELKYDRETLYREIWEEPVSVVAQRYGISDTGLRKICGRLDIPYPTRGHWAKVKAGKEVEYPALPVFVDTVVG